MKNLLENQECKGFLVFFSLRSYYMWAWSGVGQGCVCAMTCVWSQRMTLCSQLYPSTSAWALGIRAGCQACWASTSTS